MKGFTITKADDLFNESDIASWTRKGIWGNKSEDMDCTFRAYDDDGNFYVSGYLQFKYAESLANYLACDMGVTKLKLYDLKTGKYIDEIS